MSNHASAHDSRTDTIDAHCGHDVLPANAFQHGEFRLCEDCYLETDREWFGLEDYPDVLQSRTITAIEGRGSSTVTNCVKLVATTQDRRALYHDERNDRFWFVAPLHSDYHDTADAVRAPIQQKHVDATLGAPPDFSRDAYCTLPNGDHLACVETAEAPFNIRRWVEDHADELRTVRDRYQPRSHSTPQAE